MADQRSVEMLPLNSAGRNFACKSLARGLSTSVFAFSNIMREYLDPIVKTDQCAHYLDDFVIAANIATDLTRNIQPVFKCFRQAGLKLTVQNCYSANRQVEFHGRTISPEGISQQARKFRKFPSEIRFTKLKKEFQRYLGYVNLYRNYTPRMTEKRNPVYKLLKADTSINSTSESTDTFDSKNKAVSDARELALKQSF